MKRNYEAFLMLKIIFLSSAELRNPSLESIQNLFSYFAFQVLLLSLFNRKKVHEL